MIAQNLPRKISFISALVVLVVMAMLQEQADAATMNDYCVNPPFIAQSAPPLVMFEVGREHKLYYQAYNDASDLDNDGQIDAAYKHSIDYYGYFDPYKCYTHSGGSGATDKFTPVSTTADKFCSAGQWSGNVLNWLTMARIDALRKVLYGGYRSADSGTSTVLQRVYVPQDAHSWGKEFTGRLCYNGSAADPNKYNYTCTIDSDCGAGYSCLDKSQNLIGIAAALAPNTCSTSTAVSWGTTGKILVVDYNHDSSLAADTLCGADHTNLILSYNPLAASPLGYTTHYYVNDFNDTTLAPGNHHNDYYNIFAVTEFNVLSSKKGDWQFAIGGDDGVEVEVDGIVVASGYGCHSSTGGQDNFGTVTLNTAGYHRLIVRHTQKTGQDGVKVWYKKPGDASWTIFGSTLTLRAPTITSSGPDNRCTIKTDDFIQTGTPTIGTTARRHLFCSTTLSADGTPILRKLENMTNRVWEWSAKERPVCDNSLGTPTDYTVAVEVCKAGLLETNCKNYGGNYKPVGLLQKYGEGDGSKVCSKTFSAACTTDNDCGGGEGLCVNRVPMFFGLMTDTYTKNLSGGVLRKNPGSILDETNANNGQFQTSENVQGNIIHTLDRLKVIGYRYSDYSYQDSVGGSCGWIETRPLQEGECRMWGNPIAEMMYESMRYFAGKGAPTAEFDYSTSADSSVNLSKPSWGYPKGSNTYQPYDIFPSCSKPFILILSDVNTSYDSDQIPGSSFKKTDGTYFAEDALAPHLGLGDVTSGVSLLNQLAETIGASEGIIGSNWFIGENGTIKDFICSSKNVTKFSLLRGMCPEEPTKQGSFYAAAVAYYGHSYMQAKTGKPNVTTFAVALSSPSANLKFRAGSHMVTIVPVGKSVSGAAGVYGQCAAKCTLSSDSDGLHISSCAADAFCPSNQIVNMFVQQFEYNAAGEAIYAKFKINYEDSEQGADHDMDAIVSYEICTQAAKDNSLGSCGIDLVNSIQVKMTSDYGAGGIDQVLGFVISGTTSDGVYLPVKDKDVPGTANATTPTVVANLPLSWSKTFPTTGLPAGFINNPLWYAAKWGGFIDMNGNDKPDLSAEWNKNGSGDPDNYFLVQNPLELERQLDKALSEILARVSSGTAASILSDSSGSGANLIQAVFYPKKIFGATEISWTGELQDLWYYIDPFLKYNNIREDTDGDRILNLKNDLITQFVFDNAAKQTKVIRRQDSDGNGAPNIGPYLDKIDPDDTNSLWKAGRLLWGRTSSSRHIFTTTDVGSYAAPTSPYYGTLMNFSATNAASLRPFLQAGDATEATNIINYIRGTEITGYRGRTVTIGGSSGAWKLGDVISSTPKMLTSGRINTYDTDYPIPPGTSPYFSYYNSDDYKNRGMVYAGANDGMLHAFNLGLLREIVDPFQKAQLLPPANGGSIGEEAWAFVPKNVLPYLKYLSDNDYCHLYYVDGAPYLVDASIETVSTCGSSDYAACPSQAKYLLGTNKLDLANTSWRTVMIGGMGLGGASTKTTDSTCTAGAAGTCVKTPIMDPADATKAVGYSSYYALDVTEPYDSTETDATKRYPKLMWEFTDPDLGYSLSGPAIARVVGTTSDNGKWFAVFGSGPTGPIDTTAHQFLGQSDQNLTVFVLDLKSGALLRKFDTLKDGTKLANAFAGSLVNSTIELQKGTLDSGYYQDDAIYFGYTQKNATTGRWTDGGVLRLATNQDQNPANWELTKLMDGIGPVTSSVTNMLAASTSNAILRDIWLYFGSGRYFYKTGSEIDDAGGLRALYGVKDPCYNRTNKLLDLSCTGTAAGKVAAGSLTNQTTSVTNIKGTAATGWVINLPGSTPGYAAERVITDPVAAPPGLVYFTSFRPTADICSSGGDSFLWALSAWTGGSAITQGQAVLQVSTGSFEEIDLTSAFTAEGGRKTTAMTGVPPKAQGLSLMVKPQPKKKILQIMEK